VIGPHEVLERLGVEAELRHVELQVALVEEPHDDLLAPDRRQDADAEVHLAPLAELELDAPVLREAALGDVERRHDLEAAAIAFFSLSGGVISSRSTPSMRYAHAELLLVRLDVDVARALLDGVEQHHVDEADDGGVLARLLELEEVDVLLLAGEVDLVLVEAGHHLVVGGAGVVILLDGRRIAVSLAMTGSML
jgi:hypothetical protein